MYFAHVSLDLDPTITNKDKVYQTSQCSYFMEIRFKFASASELFMSAMLNTLEWDTLEWDTLERQCQAASLTLLYKFQNQTIALNPDLYLNPMQYQIIPPKSYIRSS